MATTSVGIGYSSMTALNKAPAANCSIHWERSHLTQIKGCDRFIPTENRPTLIARNPQFRID